MTLPVTIPNTFANATSSIPLSQLDANFSTLSNVINQINAGTQAVANLTSSNVTITGGTIANVTLDNVTVDVETLSNVTINGGNVTVTNMVATTANATTGNITTVNATTIDTTNIEVTNIKAKDGTAALSIADSTGVTTQSTPAVISVNSSSDALRITQTGAGNALVVEDSTNPDSTPFVVDANGNVVIGATTPTTEQFSGTARLSVSTFGDPYYAASFATYTNDTFESVVSLLKSRSTTAGGQTILQAGDTIGSLRFQGSDGTGFIQAASIAAVVDGTPGTNDMPGRLAFYTTADGASSPTERMRITSSGSVSIGTTAPAAGRNFVVNANITGSTTSRAYTAIGTVQSDVTSTASYFATSVSVQDAAFALTNLSHFEALQGTISGGSRLGVTNQYGFNVGSSLTGATNNYGFYSNIASGTDRWNFYANGTAQNYFAGKVGVGITPFSDTSGISIGASITGGTIQSAINVYGIVASDVTSQAFGYYSQLGTAAASFTLSNLYHYRALQLAIGAGSTVTNQAGFIVEASLTGATNNYGFYSNIASGTGRWNFYAAGTAENYLGGNLKIGGTAARGTTAGTNHLSLFNGTAPAGTLTNGVTMYSSSGDLNFMDAAGNGYKVGYRNVPAVGTKTGSYTLAVGDVGKYVQVGSGGSITIPDATFAEGDIVSVFNNTSGNITITCSITTAYIAGTDADKASVTLATRGVATILFISGTVCVISGNVS